MFLSLLFIKNYDFVLLYIMHTCYVMYFSFTSQKHFMAFFENYYSNSFMFKRMEEKSIARKKFPLKLTRIFGLKNCTMFNVLRNCLQKLCHFLKELRRGVWRCKLKN